jgi:hypothetical protein
MATWFAYGRIDNSGVVATGNVCANATVVEQARRDG